MNIEEVEFDEELYKRNIEENDFSGSETNGKGDENDSNES